MIKKLPKDIQKALETPDNEIDFSDFQKACDVTSPAPIKDEIKLNKKELKETLDVEIKQHCRFHILRAVDVPLELDNQSVLIKDVEESKVDARDIDMIEIAKDIHEQLIHQRKYDKIILDATRSVKFDRDYVMEIVMECCAEECKKYEKSQKIEADINILKGRGKDLKPRKKRGTGGQEDEVKVPTLDTFKEMAKKHKDVESFMKDILTIKNVPQSVADSFFDKYGNGGDLTPKQAAQNLLNEVHSAKKSIQIEESINLLKSKEKLIGGQADGKPSSKYDQSELKIGIKHEMEHTDDPKKAEEIAKDHLEEDAKYYTKLKELDKSGIQEDIDFIKGGPGSGKKQGGFSPVDSEKVFQRQAAAKRDNKDKEKKQRSKAAMAKLMLDLAMNKQKKMAKAEEVVEIKCDCDGAANCNKCKQKPCKDAGDGCDRVNAEPLANQDDIITS